MCITLSPPASGADYLKKRVFDLRLCKISTMDTLPLDCFALIAACLSVADLASLRSTGKLLNRTCCQGQ